MSSWLRPKDPTTAPTAVPSYRSAISAVTFVVHDGLVTRWSGKVAQATTAGITKEVVTGALDPLIAMLAGPDSAKIRGGLTSELASASGFSSPRTQGKAFQFWMEVESAEKPAYARAEINALPAKASPTDLVSGVTASKQTTLDTKKLKESLSDAGFTCSGMDGPVVATVDCSGPATIKSGAFKGQLSNLAITVGLDAQSDAATTLSPVSKALESALGGRGAAVTDVITDKLQPGAFTLEKVGDLLVVIDALAADRVQIDVFL